MYVPVRSRNWPSSLYDTQEHRHGQGNDDMDADLVLAPLPDVPAHVELVLSVALLPDQVVKLVHGQADDVLLLTNRNGKVFKLYCTATTTTSTTTTATSTTTTTTSTTTTTTTKFQTQTRSSLPGKKGFTETRRYGQLRGPTSSFCGGLRPSAGAF